MFDYGDGGRVQIRQVLSSEKKKDMNILKKYSLFLFTLRKREEILNI